MFEWKHHPRTPVERPAFLMVGVNGFAVGPDQIAQILSQLGPDYVAVRPDELCELYRRWKRQGVDAHPAPRPALDLTPPPASATTRLEGGALIVAEHSERPAVVGWYTDPRGTAWVRKRLHLDPPAGAREATIKAFVRGRAGNHVTFRVNGAEHVAVLPGAKWMWVEIRVPATELKDGENEIWYTGNPGGRLFTGGDPSLNLGHSDYGAPGTWTPLGGELLITVDVR
ncbi:MAG: hypothetical protein HYU66_14045 [Armatimonadetes bacterium]|nr:hypothetical protein [Armatimonadota bacterium]